MKTSPGPAKPTLHSVKRIIPRKIPLNYILLAMTLWNVPCYGLAVHDHGAYQYRDILPHGIVNCGQHNALSTDYCLTIDEEPDTLEAGRCLYNYNRRDRIYSDLPRSRSKLNDFMCGLEAELNRTGTLCGKCQDGSLIPST